MAVDEFYFHWRRGLPRWERLGHPLDTLTVLACQGWLCLSVPNAWTLSVYVILSIFSCLFVTKDEFIHQPHCRPGEHWLHAILFVLHPLILLGAGLLWATAHGTLALFAKESWEFTALRGYLASIALFGLYQLVFWNWLWQWFSNKFPSITKSTIS